MRTRRPQLLLLLALTACDTSELFSAIQPPPMVDPVGQSQNSPSQLGPELANRVNAERSEPLPTPPPMPDADYYGNIGTVPPKPVLPTPADIAGDTKELEAEQQAGALKIAAQTGEPLPDTLPKPNAKGPAPANPVYVNGAPSGDAANVAPASTLRLAGDNSAFLPQSETVEATDLIPPAAR